MTQERLSIEEVSFSRVINTSEKNFHLQNQSKGIDLEIYFQTLFQLEPFSLPIFVCLRREFSIIRIRFS